MKPFDLDQVEEAKDFERVAPGGYICKITGVEDVPEKEYLKLEYDIAEGKFKDYYTKLYQAKGFWGGRMIRSYKGNAKSFFKAFTTAVEKSNGNYKWDFNEVKLKNKLIGLVLGEEEYRSSDDKIKTRLYVVKTMSVERIRKQDYKMPELKKLEKAKAISEAPEGFFPIDDSVYDDEVPF